MAAQRSIVRHPELDDLVATTLGGLAIHDAGLEGPVPHRLERSAVEDVRLNRRPRLLHLEVDGLDTAGFDRNAGYNFRLEPPVADGTQRGIVKRATRL